MIDVACIEYAQARLQARIGQRPDEAAWRRIEVIRELPALLEAARNSAFRHWIAGLTAQSNVHEIEAALRAHWRALVAEVAGWMPQDWQLAVLWCRVLADLPALHYLSQGGASLTWMRNDPAYRDVCEAEPDTRFAVLSTGSLAPFAQAWDNSAKLSAVWRAEWLRRSPRGPAADSLLLDEVANVFTTHLDTFRGAASADAWPLRRALQARLTMLFRRATLDPAAAFAFLGLCALDLERLRGELVRRAAFPRLLA